MLRYLIVLMLVCLPVMNLSAYDIYVSSPTDDTGMLDAFEAVRKNFQETEERWLIQHSSDGTHFGITMSTGSIDDMTVDTITVNQQIDLTGNIWTSTMTPQSLNVDKVDGKDAANFMASTATTGGTIADVLRADIPTNMDTVTTGLVYWQLPNYQCVIATVTVSYSYDGTDASGGNDNYDISVDTTGNCGGLFNSVLSSTDTLQIANGSDNVTISNTDLNATYQILPANTVVRFDCDLADGGGGDPVVVIITIEEYP
jgi:hypothetical protein